MAKNYALLPEAVTMYTQTEALKEAKDMSKNLVNGDFEREYRSVKQRNGKRQWWYVNALALAVGALAGCLLVLTVVREVDIARLRQEVDELTANMIAVTANVKSLNQKLSNNKLLNEFKPSEDTIYADEDQDGEIAMEDTKDSNKDKTNYDSLEKLHGLTVLEDDDDMNDDEDYDGTEESGEWYPDYDRRREKIGTTHMVRLKPEDFTGAVLTIDNDQQSPESRSATIRELKRILNQNPEVADPTLPPSTEPTPSRSKRSVISDSIAASIEHFTAPKVMAKMEERRKTKKFLPNSESATLRQVDTNTISRIARNSDEGGKPFIAAHFHGNTSHLNPEIHEHYKGNGLVRVSHDAPHDVWYPSSWTIASPHPRPTLTKNGHIRVHHTGVYLVYVQIYYLDSHDIISWVLHRTNADIDGRETLLQCAQSSHSSERLDKPNSCFSASALLLRAGDRLAVRNTGGDRHSLMEPEKSFIGLIKLADAEDPNKDY